MKVMVIKTNDVTYRLPIENLALSEKEVVLNQTKRSFEAWTTESSAGELSLVMVWWLARRAEGERNLSWDEAKAQWPGMEGFEVEVVDDTEPTPEDSPSSSGPA